MRIQVKLNKRFTANELTPPSVLNAIGKSAVSEVKKNFEAQGRPKWQPSKRGGKTLQDTGRLRDSVKHKIESGRVFLTSNLSYARIHNYGGIIRTRYAVIQMPKREFMILPSNFDKKVASIVKQYVGYVE